MSPKHSKCRLHQRWLLLIGVNVLLLSCISQTAPGLAQSAPPATPCRKALETYGSVDRGELSLTEKTGAFADVLLGTSYQGYRFPVQQILTSTTNIPSVLLKSVAGVETGWDQYNNDGWTRYNPNPTSHSCDMGMLQINDIFSESLFDLQPSLRSDTRANIAAGAVVLAQWWNQGISGPLPVVNDSDPEWLINWYYALSSYNGGPDRETRVWANNPNCNQVILNCGPSIDYSTTRKDGANWNNLQTGNYPYQESVLYNLAFPHFPNQSSWVVGGLGLKPVYYPFDHGILPDDAVFLSPSGTSAAPNLLLFPHRAAPVDAHRAHQRLTLEYELPFAAAVRLSILRNGQPLSAQNCVQNGLAGWNTLECPISAPLQIGDTYRLRAELGSLDDPTSYYVGQYTQDLHFAGGPQALPLTHRVTLPIVLNQRLPDNLLRNGTFSIGQPDQPLWPEYWQIQSTLSREDNTNPGAVISSTYRLEPSGGLVLKATRRGAADVRQRVHLAAGTYELRVQVNVLNRDPQTSLQIRARPARPGPGVWSVIERIPADGAGRRTYTYRLRLAGPTTFGFLASFGPRDSTSQFQLTAVRLVRLGP